MGKRAAQALRLACPGQTPGSLRSSRMTAHYPPPGVSADLAPGQGVACGCTYFPPQKILVVMTRLDRLWNKRRRAVTGCDPLGSSLPDPPHCLQPLPRSPKPSHPGAQGVKRCFSITQRLGCSQPRGLDRARRKPTDVINYMDATN